MVHREFENSQKRQPKRKSKSDSMEESDWEFSDGEGMCEI